MENGKENDALVVQRLPVARDAFAGFDQEPKIDDIVDMFMPGLPRTGLIRTKEVCPRCRKKFIETTKGLICPDCQTVPRAYHLLVCLPGRCKEPIRLYSNRQGYPLSSWRLAFGTLLQVRQDLHEGIFDPRFYHSRNHPQLMFVTHGDGWLAELKSEVRTSEDEEGRDPQGARVLESYYLRHVKPYFAGKTLQEACEEVEPFLTAKRKQMHSDHTFKHIRSVLLQILKYAHKKKAIPSIPAFPSKKRWQKEKRAVPIPPMMTVEEQVIVVAQMPEHDQLVYETATTLGLRPSEVRRLLGTDFRDDVTPPLLMNVKAKGLKPRNVEVPMELAVKIRAYVNRRGPKIVGDKTPLFLDSRGKPYTERRLEEIWNRAMDAAVAKGLIPAEKRGALKFGTRHAVATQRLDAGESPEVVAKALGNSPQVLLKHYDHRTTIRLRHRPGGSGTTSPCAPPAPTHQK